MLIFCNMRINTTSKHSTKLYHSFMQAKSNNIMLYLRNVTGQYLSELSLELLSFLLYSRVNDLLELFYASVVQATLELSFGFLGLASGAWVSFDIAFSFLAILLQGDVGGLGEFAPLHQFARDHGCKLGRRAADEIDAVALQSLDDGG